jgi:hypothetical protein
MDFLHFEHFPPKNIKLSTGMFSNHFIGFLQDGQNEFGFTIDTPRGRR